MIKIVSQACVAPTHLIPLYLAWELEPNSANYHLNFSYLLKNKESVNLLINKVQELINSTAYLRQTFSLEGGQLISTFHEKLPAEINYYSSSLKDFRKLEQELIKKPHNLNKSSPIKLNIVHLKTTHDYWAIFSIHHIVMDGTSLDRFIIDLNNLFENKPIEIETIENYLNQIKHENPLCEETLDRSLTGYLAKIEKISHEIDFTKDDSQQEVLHFTQTLPLGILEKLDILSTEHQISKFSVLILAYGVFLTKVFDKKQMLIDYPINIRTNKNINGCFLNILTLPIQYEKNDTFITLINGYQELLPILKHAAKYRLQNKSNFLKIPIFSSLTMAQLQDLRINKISYKAKSYPQITHANVSLKYREKENNFYFVCDLLPNIFSKYFSNSFLQRFFNLLNKLLTNPALSLSNIDLLMCGEDQKILYNFNGNKLRKLILNKTINQLFEEQAEKTPDSIAIICGRRKINYQSLNKKSNQLARYIEEKSKKTTRKNKPNKPIIIFLSRSIDMVISILGILKTGGYYIPIDAEFPNERIKFIIRDTNSELVITNSLYVERLKEINLDIRLIIIDKNSYKKKSKENFTPKHTSNDLAYVMYSSGTTGDPKGVMIEHKSVINTLNSLYQIYQVEKNSKATAYTSYVFDVSVAEIFTVLTRGGELHILTEERKNIDKLSKYLNEKKINTTYLPPAILSILPKINYPHLDTIIFAGEPCDQATGQYWSKKYNLYNCYGPTEACIYAIMTLASQDNINEIGKPIDNVKAYVLDSDLNLVPIGLIGELYLAGVGLARGYLNNTKLTQQRFIKNHFQTKDDKSKKENERLYKTGDLVRWLPHGGLEYIGRNDFQVKISGYRIELGEIESRMRDIEGIQQAIVTALESEKQSKFLVGYYTGKEAIDVNKLKTKLKEHLVDYMMPHCFLYLKEFPINSSGKIDRKLLPKPDLKHFTLHYVAPTTIHEEYICQVFANVLGLEKIGADDDFFNLGGDSIKAIRLIARLQEYFNINIADVFNLRSPRKIAKNIRLEGNILQKKLKQIISCYEGKKKDYDLYQPAKSISDKYFASISQLPNKYHTKPIKSVLLTGATGFLGCNLLNQLLKLTNYNIFLLVRAKSNDEAFIRLNKKFKFYFEKSLDEIYNSKIFVYAADIEKNNFNLPEKDYQFLLRNIDSIIHAAALVKHYGRYEQFYSINVQATIYLLEFAALTENRDFHHISTISVARGKKYFTEDDSAIASDKEINNYIKTKIEAERIIILYREKGINSNIYRVGNLAFIAENMRAQENKEDNGFFHKMKFFVNLGLISPPFGIEEISAVDYTAQAIVKLFDKKELHHMTFHIFNPYPCNIAKIFSHNKELSVNNVSTLHFIDIINKRLQNPLDQPWIQRFMLHQGWLDDTKVEELPIRIFQNKTQLILKLLDFEWHPVSDQTFLCYLKENFIIEPIPSV